MSKTSSNRWLLLVLLNSLLIQGATYVVRPMVSYRLLDLGADPAMVGLIGAFYALAPLLLSIQLGKWVDRGRDGVALFLGACIAAIATVILIFSTSIQMIALAMPVLGMGHLLTMVGGQTMIAKLAKDKDYERNFGLLTFYASLGQAVGPFFGGVLASKGNQTDTTSPMIFAVFLFLLAVLAALPLLASGKPSRQSPKTPLPKGQLQALLRTPNFKAALFVSGAITAVVDVVTIFLPVLGAELGFSAFEVGLVLAIRSTAAMAIRLVLGRINEKLGPRILINSGALLTALCCAAVFFVEDFWLLTTVMAVAGFSMAIGQPASMAWISRITAAENRGLAISIRLTSNRFGQVVVPMIAGAFAVSGVGPVFLMLAGLQIVSLAVSARALEK
jgi:MFS family permease